MPGHKDPPKATRFKPGQSGNPTGYSRGRRLTDVLLKLIDKDRNTAIELMRVGLEEAIKGDFRYWKEIFDRIDGRPGIAEQADEAAMDDVLALREHLGLNDDAKKPR